MAAAIHHIHNPILLLTFLLAAATASPWAAPRASASARPSNIIIRSTCASVTNRTESTPYPYCVRTLSSVPAALAARDARGLAIAATNLTANNIASTMHILNQLIDALQNCLVTYKSMQAAVAGALKDLHAGRFDVASEKLKGASFQPGFCELALMESNTDKDPMMEDNDVSELVSTMAYNIAELSARHAAK